MDDNTCHPCEQNVVEKFPACPLQCRSPKCKAYKWVPIDSYQTPIVWVLGGPGTDKSAQCGKISSKYGFTLITTSELLRAEAKTESDRAQCLTKILERDEQVPNDVVLELVKEAMYAGRSGAKGYVIDGYPRNKTQCVSFEKEVAPATVIIYLEASRETLTKRLMERADNSEEAVKLQIKTFMENYNLILAHYTNKIHRVNAEGTVESIFNEVEKILDPIVAK